MRNILAATLYRLARWLQPKRIPTSLAGNQWTGECPPTPIGVAEISRWSSAARPPDVGDVNSVPTPLGVAESDTTRLWHPSGVQCVYVAPGRWSRCARPPANICDPYRGRNARLEQTTGTEDMISLSAQLIFTRRETTSYGRDMMEAHTVS